MPLTGRWRLTGEVIQVGCGKTDLLEIVLFITQDGDRLTAQGLRRAYIGALDVADAGYRTTDESPGTGGGGSSQPPWHMSRHPHPCGRPLARKADNSPACTKELYEPHAACYGLRTVCLHSSFDRLA